MNRYTFIGKVLSAVVVVNIALFVMVANTVPLTIWDHFVMDGKGISSLSPANRVEYEKDFTRLKNDIVYFNSKHTKSYEEGSIRVKYRNPSSQELWVGFKDQDSWHYDQALLDSPLMNNAGMTAVGDGPYLYQKTKKYDSVSDFWKNPPSTSVVGIYNYTTDISKIHPVKVADYKPAKVETVLTTPLRGKFTMYAYLDKEPFMMSFVKKDLNWEAGPDETRISVYKDQQRVLVAAITDDLNVTNNKKVGGNQEVALKNPGPELPESGVYRIVVEQPGDAVISSIRTNLHKIVFDSPVWIAGNKEVYGPITAKTAETSLYSSGGNVSFQVFHDAARQTVSAGKQSVKADTFGKEYPLQALQYQDKIAFPKSDAYINSAGVLAFSADSLFMPFPFRTQTITTAGDIQKVDYILSSYSGPPKKEGDWSVAERGFDLRLAKPNGNKLSWIFRSPGLQSNNQSMDISEVELLVKKEGWVR